MPQQTCWPMSPLLAETIAYLSTSGTPGVVLDLDGTMWCGKSAIPGAAHFWDYLVEKSIPTVLLTNSGERRACDVQEKIQNIIDRKVCVQQIWTAMDHLASILMHQIETLRIEEVLVIANPENMRWVMYPPRQNAVRDVRMDRGIIRDGNAHAMLHQRVFVSEKLSRIF